MLAHDRRRDVSPYKTPRDASRQAQRRGGFCKSLSHNVFWFQGTPFRTDQPPAPDPAIIARLAAVYAAFAPDVVCLQEIQSREAFEQAGERFGMQGCYCPGGDLPQYGGAVFWRDGCGCPVLDSRQCRTPTQRMWQIVEAADSGRRWRIANVHLPSSRQLAEPRAAAQRLAEIGAVLDAVRPAPGILAGDFNERPGGAASRYLEERGYADAAQRLGCDGQPSCLNGRRLDYVWHSRRTGGRLRQYGVAGEDEIALRDGRKQHLSDHLPVWAEWEG